ncbi:MAG TPA: type 4a pilus biogenesis protein PilO [Herbaspirillum sp.]|jgi:type IV pilus assembly protein PilO
MTLALPNPLRTTITDWMFKAATALERWRRQHPRSGRWLPRCAAATVALLAGSGLVWLFPYQAAKADLQQLQQQEIASKQAYVLQLQHAPQIDLNLKQAGTRRAERRLILLEQQLTGIDEQEAVMNEIDTAGLARGLRFTLFKPALKQDQNTGIAVQLKAVGTYQAITRFADDIARLPRIVILDPLVLQAVAGKDSASGLLALQATATAFQSARQQYDRSDDEN